MRLKATSCVTGLSAGRTRVALILLAALAGGGVAHAGHAPRLTAFEPLGDSGDRRFVHRGPDAGLVVAATTVDFVIAPGHEIRMELLGGDTSARVAGDGELDGRSNYYLGGGAGVWRTGVPRFAAVRVSEVWPGIDLVYYFRNDGQPEFDFVVAMDADPGVIQLAFSGADGIREDNGGLTLQRGRDSVRVHRPSASQEQAPVGARFVLDDACTARLELEPWDRRRALVIDPLVSFSTYLGGTAFELSRGVGSDAAGNIYVVGETNSLDFPTMNPIQPSFAGGSWDLFVAKLDPTGSTLLFATYLGGSGAERDRSIFVDGPGNVYVTGDTTSIDYPTQLAFQATNAGGLDAIVTKLSPGGALLYSTYIGGSGADIAYGIAVDPAGRAHLVGSTASADFPTVSPFQGAFAGGTNDSFIARLDATGAALSWASFLGGSGDDNGRGLALAADGTMYACGTTDSLDFPLAGPAQPANAGGIDAFASHIDPNLGLVYSSYLGGSGSDRAQSIVVSVGGEATLSGVTTSADFPTVNASQPGFAGGGSDVFLSRLAAGGAMATFSTYLGGSGRDWAFGLAQRGDGRLLVAGSTNSTDFPTLFPVQANFAGGGVSALGDAFLSEIDPAVPALVCSTYLGGSEDDQAEGLVLDPSGFALLSGRTDSDDFPLVAPFQPAYLSRVDVFVAKLGCTAAPASIGNTLRLSKSIPTAELVFTWVDVSDAPAYRLYSERSKSLPPSVPAGQATSGVPGLTLPSPAEPLLYFDLRAANCCGES